ncbi:hypothetical protein [Thalassococcus sp. S3]|uniref:hypothetical protein n=1 Tax=Thalassococcus sp. S3 TaxID=2017482 RepID=UPI0010248C65|nr:hypothetical protein [Thalassococcus sp. S3]QBF32009.1 hypothetical protein CFI11_12365 [Thalassococcus sp. S3]
MKPVVVRSINAEGEMRCVDILRDDAGRFAFREYRRDPEDGRGWGGVGPDLSFVHDSAEAALAAARESVAWLERAE